ncbi:benzoate carboxyl methyltransferase-like [Andrographis paniculata]|uniref:benzoate carboxyl methyltransferase-like n=1 Tax=Andrographis paniculata TaxID=175694 RepID=UPI0021E8D63B|nr:benzoate carboxyl methyltransferase-like [Andrographis paniculata]
MEKSFVLRVNGGDDAFSYANNSALQKFVMSKMLHVLEEAIEEMFVTKGFKKSFKFVDLGCASGPNTLIATFYVMETIKNICRDGSLPQCEVYLNDLPNNDYNNLFRMLPNFHQRMENCFIFGLPGSFYGRLLPNNSLHFAYSCYSLHWLSQIPERVGRRNKENICVARTSPREVIEAYAKQYHRDFMKFLKCRGEEMISGGKMVLAFIGRKTTDQSSKEDTLGPLGLLGETLSNMVDEGLVNKEYLYSFNVPAYAPSRKEVNKIIEQEGSFKIDKIEDFELPWDANGYEHDNTKIVDRYISGKLIAEGMRAFIEPMLVYHFRNSTINIDDLFNRYAQKVANHIRFVGGTPSYDNLLLSLHRK